MTPNQRRYTVCPKCRANDAIIDLKTGEMDCDNCGFEETRLPAPARTVTTEDL